LLPGFYLKDAPEFETWLLAERERWQTAVLQAMDRLAAHHQIRGENDTARRYLQRALDLDPWHEQAHRDLMRLLALSGDSAGALAQYEKCRESLQAGLGVEPLPETQALAAHIRSGSLPIQANDTGSLALQFVGRGGEHAQLVRLFQRQRATPHLVLLAGALGIGKSRLMEEFGRYAASRGALLLSGRCLAFGVPVPYQPFVMALRVGLTAARTPLSPAWGAELARLLPELGAPADDGDETARQRLFTAVATFLGTLGQPKQPIVLLLDDLHWVDAASLDLLKFLLYHAPPRLLVVGSYRLEDTAAEHALIQLRRELSRDGLVTHMFLPGLDETAVQTITASLVQAKQVTELARYLWQESHGNGFVLKELLYELAETYELTALPWQLPLHWADGLQRLTERIRDVVLGRVVRLPAASQEALNKAAVIGTAFTLDVLTAVQPDPLLPEYLHQWQKRGLVRSAGHEFEFAHEKIRAVLLEALPPEQKADWHRRVAEALLQIHPNAVSELAHHFFLSPEPMQALPFLLKAAQQAASALAFAEAIALCSQALALMPAAPDMQVALLLLRQRAYQFLGETEAEGQDAVALLLLAQTAGNPQQLAAAVQRLSRFYYQRGRVTEARQAVAEILKVARESGEVETAVRLLNMMAMLFRETTAGQAEAAHWQSEALRLAREAGDARMEGLLLSDTAVVLSEKGDWGAALTQVQTGLDLLRQAKATSYWPHALYILAGLYRAVGQYVLAETALDEALNLCRAHQLGAYLIQVFLEQGQLALVQHRLPEARQSFAQVRQLAEEGGRPLIVARTLLSLGQVAYQSESFAEAQGLLAQARALCPADKVNLQAAIQAALALALLGLDREAAALETSAAAIKTVANTAYVFTDRPQIYWSHVQVLRATAQAAEARHWLQKAAGILAKEAATLPEEMQEGFKKAVALHRVILQQATHS
jgi:predicted ATPase